MFQEEINDAVAAEEVVEKEYVDETLVCKDCGVLCIFPSLFSFLRCAAEFQLVHSFAP